MKKKYEKPQLISEKMELSLLCGTCTLAHDVVKMNKFRAPCTSPCAAPIPNISPV